MKIFVFIAALFVASVVQSQEDVVVVGCPQDGAVLTYHGGGFSIPYESTGAVEHQGRFVASVFQADCDFAPRYTNSFHKVTFDFCTGSCPDIDCLAPYGRARWDFLGFGHGTVIEVHIKDADVWTYPGCGGEVGDWHRTKIYAGSPVSETAIKVTWSNSDNMSQKGYTWHSISSAFADEVAVYALGYDLGGINTAYQYSTRTLRLCFNSQLDVTQYGKRFGINSTVENATITKVELYGIVFFESEQTGGIIELQAGVELDAEVQYYHTHKPQGPIVEWINN